MFCAALRHVTVASARDDVLRALFFSLSEHPPDYTVLLLAIMFFDTLPVYVVTLLSSLFLSATFVHGQPTSPSPLAADFASSLRLIKYRPLTSVDLTDERADASSDESDEAYANLLSRRLFRLADGRASLTATRRSVPPAAFALAQSASEPEQAGDYEQTQEPIRLSASLKKLVETNPIARAWLTLLLQKLMQEQPVPYIFKYGRRRK